MEDTNENSEITMRCVALAVPLYYQDDANRLAVCMGWDEPPGNTYVVELALATIGPEGPATHSACNTSASIGFIPMLKAAKSGSMPEGVDWTAGGAFPDFSEARAIEVCQQILYREDSLARYGRVGDQPSNFDLFLRQEALVRVISPVEIGP